MSSCGHPLGLDVPLVGVEQDVAHDLEALGHAAVLVHHEALRGARALVEIVRHAVTIGIERAADRVHLHTLRGVRALVGGVRHAVTVAVERAPVRVHLGALGGPGALVEVVRHAVTIGVERTADRVHLHALGGAGALVEVVGHAVAVAVGVEQHVLDELRHRGRVGQLGGVDEVSAVALRDHLLEQLGALRLVADLDRVDRELVAERRGQRTGRFDLLLVHVEAVADDHQRARHDRLGEVGVREVHRLVERAVAAGAVEVVDGAVERALRVRIERDGQHGLAGRAALAAPEGDERALVVKLGNGLVHAVEHRLGDVELEHLLVLVAHRQRPVADHCELVNLGDPEVGIDRAGGDCGCAVAQAPAKPTATTRINRRPILLLTISPPCSMQPTFVNTQH